MTADEATGGLAAPDSGFAGADDDTAEPLLQVRDLCIAYRSGAHRSTPVVRNVDLDVYPNESVALVGESGCGKTTLALAMVRLLPKLGMITGGSLRYRDRDGSVSDLLSFGEETLRQFRWTEVAVVFQGAQNSLNPLSRIRTQFIETARAHSRRMSIREIEDRAVQLLELVRLEPARVLPAYPHELSGGMRQRVLIALGLLLDPRLVILDEPTTALDILTQRAVVEVLRDLQRELQFSMVFVTHDLALAAELADRVATMYGGRIVELAGVREAFYEPRHPYTVGLIRAVVPLSGGMPDVVSIPGTPPSFRALPNGCSFHPRCPYAQDVCAAEEPPLIEVGPDHAAACFFADRVSKDKAVSREDA